MIRLGDVRLDGSPRLAWLNGLTTSGTPTRGQCLDRQSTSLVTGTPCLATDSEYSNKRWEPSGEPRTGTANSETPAANCPAGEIAGDTECLPGTLLLSMAAAQSTRHPDLALPAILSAAQKSSSRGGRDHECLATTTYELPANLAGSFSKSNSVFRNNRIQRSLIERTQRGGACAAGHRKMKGCS